MLKQQKFKSKKVLWSPSSHELIEWSRRTRSKVIRISSLCSSGHQARQWVVMGAFHLSHKFMTYELASV